MRPADRAFGAGTPRNGRAGAADGDGSNAGSATCRARVSARRPAIGGAAGALGASDRISEATRGTAAAAAVGGGACPPALIACSLATARGAIPGERDRSELGGATALGTRRAGAPTAGDRETWRGVDVGNGGGIVGSALRSPRSSIGSGLRTRSRSASSATTA